MRALSLLALLVGVACQRSAPPASPLAPAASAPSASPSAAPQGAPSAVPESGAAGAAALAVAVDPRVELLSILCRLAGHAEYQRAYDTPYRRAADAYFEPFRNHSAVAATASLRARSGISFDAPMQFAVHLDPTTFGPAVRLDPPPSGLDGRWRAVDRAAYAALVQDFARTSGFAEFWESQATTRHAVEERYRDVLAAHPIVSWFDGVFGPRDAAYHLAPGLLTGPMAYGVRATRKDGGEDLVQVMYLEAVDAAGLPQPGERTVEYLVHELAHSYVNPICDPVEELAVAAQPLFERTAAAMRKQNYTTPLILVDESVVRAVTILYLRERGTPDQAARSLSEQRALSFSWTDDLATALAAARASRSGRLTPADLVAAARATFERAAAVP